MRKSRVALGWIVAAVLPVAPAVAWSQSSLVSVPGRPAPDTPDHHSSVRYAGGMLTVAANDVSLDHLLGEIARQTGLKVNGSVRSDHVFGTYGPAAPGAVLTSLLDGTGTNVLLVKDSTGAPSELILTPRLGGPTPPTPAVAQSSPEGDTDPGEPGAPSFRNPRPYLPSAGRSTPVTVGPDLHPPASLPTTNNSSSQTIVFPPINATSTPATATTSSDTTQEKPEGVRTPQQIFEQLQRLRQQQEQIAPPATAPASPPR